MTDIINSVFDFIVKLLSIPQLHAIIVASVLGMAVTYLLSLKLPAITPIKLAVRFSRVLIFFTVVGTAYALIPTFIMLAWATSLGITLPLFYEWLTAIIYHRWPWLQPKALRPDGPVVPDRPEPPDDQEHA